MNKKYSKELTKKVLSSHHVHTHPNLDRIYAYKNQRYLVRDDKILCHGGDVFSYPNRDYSYVNAKNRTVLMRNNEILYITEPGLSLYCNQERSPDSYILYQNGIGNSRLLIFPSGTKDSILNIIDNKIKGDIMNEKEMQDLIADQAERIADLENALEDISSLVSSLDEDLIKQIQSHLSVL